MRPASMATGIRQRMYAVRGTGLIQIMLGPTTKKIRRSDGKWLVIEITIANIVRRARFDKFDLRARTAIARARAGSEATARLGFGAALRGARARRLNREGS